MNILSRLVTRLRGIRFEDYEVQTGYTNVGNKPWAGIEEFFALVGTGETHQEAIRDLKKQFYERIAYLREKGESIPLPGSGKGRAQFAASDQVESLRPFVDEFWSDILGTSYSTSFVSNESRLSAWEHYLPGGREELLRRVAKKYGVDISAYYEEPIPEILRKVKEGAA